MTVTEMSIAMTQSALKISPVLVHQKENGVVMMEIAVLMIAVERNVNNLS